ncbi:signal peptidase II [Peptoniphilus catoniae]|uniref:signal peptidase II n=1 Tax=Peptoniphilus catoniae TaxID=1660341 RepID=UPI0010FD1F41|nr:signal peptidase II [Peptoniphilus catoniae]
MGVIIFSAILILIDQISKHLVVEFLKGKPPLVIIDKVLNFYYLENRGAAFGIMQDRRILFIIITIIIILVLLSIILKSYRQNSFLYNLSLGLILGGAIGNFIDRIRLHYVVDFISVRIFGYDFAVFNLADSFIVIGTILLIIMILFYDNPERRVKNENNKI